MNRVIVVSQGVFDATRELVDERIGMEGPWRYALGPGREPIRLVPPLHAAIFFGVDAAGLPVEVVPRPVAAPESADVIAPRALREAAEAMPGQPTL